MIAFVFSQFGQVHGSVTLKLLSELPGSLGVAMSGSGPSCFALFSSYESAKSALDQNRTNLKKYGLQGWCCCFQSKGVHE